MCVCSFILYAGFKRTVANGKQQGLIDPSEGMHPISIEGFKFLARKAICESPTDFYAAITAHLFVTLRWNLMARSDSVSHIMFAHMGWEQDFMTVRFPTHKG